MTCILCVVVFCTRYLYIINKDYNVISKNKLVINIKINKDSLTSINYLIVVVKCLIKVKISAPYNNT